jgi:hypothetical protein
MKSLTDPATINRFVANDRRNTYRMTLAAIKASMSRWNGRLIGCTTSHGCLLIGNHRGDIFWFGFCLFVIVLAVRVLLVLHGGECSVNKLRFLFVWIEFSDGKQTIALLKSYLYTFDDR